jgi:hypothetical protein
MSLHHITVAFGAFFAAYLFAVMPNVAWLYWTGAV